LGNLAKFAAKRRASSLEGRLTVTQNLRNPLPTNAELASEIGAADTTRGLLADFGIPQPHFQLPLGDISPRPITGS